MQFQISVCPVGKNKPKQSEEVEKAPPTVDPPPSQALEKKLSDPFAPPYNENLYVGELKDDRCGEEYVVFVRLSFVSLILKC